MHAFKGLLVKDWYLSRKSLLLPVWIVLGFWALNILILGVAYVTHHENIHFGLNQIDWDFDQNEMDTVFPGIAFVINYALVMLPGFLGIVMAIAVGNNALNTERNQHCLSFYRSLPVNDWWFTLSKFLVNIIGVWAIILAICLAHFVVINGIIGLVSGQFSALAWNGLLLGFASFFIVGLLWGSFAFFCSSLFSSSAFFKGFLVLIGLQVLIVIMNAVYGWSLPMPISDFFQPIGTIFSNFGLLEDLGNDMGLMMSDFWQKSFAQVFNGKFGLQLLISAAFYAGGSWIYQKKEVF